MNSSAFLENLRQLFAECDTDQNGSLGRQEFSVLCSKIGLNNEAAAETFNRLDIDKDDRITFDEFAAGFNQYKSSSSSTATTAAASPPATAAAAQQAAVAPTSVQQQQQQRPVASSSSAAAAAHSEAEASSLPRNLAARDAQRSSGSFSSSSSSSNRLSTPSSQQYLQQQPPQSQRRLSPSPVSARGGRKSASPLGVLSLGSTGSSGNLASSSFSTTGGSGIPAAGGGGQSSTSFETTTSEQQVAPGGGGGSFVSDHQQHDDNVVVYSSELINGANEASGSGQFGSLLSTSSSGGGLSQMRNMQDLLESVQKLQSENQILSQIFFKDKREREEYISQLGEEFDLQLKEVEERANRRARDELEAEKRRLREMMQAERETLQHHYTTLEQMSKLVKSSTSGKQTDEGAAGIDKVRSKLEDTFHENRQLKKSLLDTKTDVALIWKEMEKLKRQYEDKLSSAYEKHSQTQSECDHIKQQLNLMKDSNRKLQDASDVITHYIADKVEPVIKVASGAMDPDNADNPNYFLSPNNLAASPGASRRGSILSEYLLNNDEDQTNNNTNHHPTVDSLTTDDPPTNPSSTGDLESLASSQGAHATRVKASNYLPPDDEEPAGVHGSNEQSQPETVEEIMSRSSKGGGLRGNGGLGDFLSPRKGVTSLTLTKPKQAECEKLARGGEQKPHVESGPEANNSNEHEQQQQIKSTTESQTKATLRGLGRHFGVGARSQPESGAKLGPTKEEGGALKSISVDYVEEPSIEPADGPTTATFNIILVGDSFVGKSSFAARFMEGNFVQGLISNCSIDFKTKAYKVDGVNYTVNLWDTAGQERFRSITASYFRKADGIILMYDVTDKRSYLNVRNWMSTISDTAAENVAVLLVGNKIDLRQQDNKAKCVPTDEGYRLAKEYDIVFLETSVKTGTNLLPSMGRLIRLIARNNTVQEEDKDRIRLSDKSRTFNCMPKNC